MDLTEWTEHHIKQKDMLRHDLVSVSRAGLNVHVELKDGKAIYYCKQDLDLGFIKGIGPEEHAYFVCENNEHNFKVLVENWDLLKTRQNFTFIFLNPNFSDRWMVKPFVHSKIADGSTLKQGLRSLFDTCIGREN